MKKSKLELPIVSLLENGCIEQSQVLNGYAKVGREASLQYIVLEEDSNVEQNYIFILMRILDGKIITVSSLNPNFIIDNQIGELLFEEAATSSVDNIRHIIPKIMQGYRFKEVLKMLNLEI